MGRSSGWDWGPLGTGRERAERDESGSGSGDSGVRSWIPHGHRALADTNGSPMCTLHGPRHCACSMGMLAALRDAANSEKAKGL